MINPISNATPAQPVAQSSQTFVKYHLERPPQSIPTKDSVSFSAVAQAAAANLQEARETSAQTAKEAGGGDLQAQRLLAKEAAAKSVAK